MIYKLKIIVLGFVLLMMGNSCTKTQLDKDREIIEKYIADNNLDAVEISNSGLYYVIYKQGGSQHPTAYSLVTVNYNGYLTDGTNFGHDDTVKLYLSQTIMGWQMGVPLIGEGGKIKLIIPSQYGYGTSEQGVIPKNSVLIFDIDLLLFN